MHQRRQQRVNWLQLSCCLAVLASVAAPALAAPLELAGQPYRGRQDFIIVGASMADATGLINGVNCLMPENSTFIKESALPPRAKLVAAKLYISGSLLDDGIDYQGPPVVRIFDNHGVGADDDRPQVEANARAAADRSVLFQPPGAAAPIRVTAPSSTVPYVTVYEKVGGTEPGNVGFFMTPIDVTNVILNEGQGLLAGNYSVSDLLADVCYGLEVVCEPGDAPPSCGSVSQTHTNGTASFALLLIIEDPSLPLTTTSVFEGMQQLLDTSRTFMLNEGIAVSDPAAGSLAAYVLEGDLGIGIERPGTLPCQADEYIEVDGDDDPTTDGLCLMDADNPRGNTFNSTINVQDRTDEPPACGAIEEQCCLGPGLCPTVGVDIDRFNISPALVPGAQEIRVTVGTGGDQIALAMVVVGVGIFEPILNVDSQLRILTAIDDRVRVGDDIIMSVAVSNTGNTDAMNAAVEFDLPAHIGDFEVLRFPNGATHEVFANGGVNGTGRVTASGFTVRPGKIAEIRLRMSTPCASLGSFITPRATVGALGIEAFQISSAQTRIGGPGVGDCLNLGLPDDPEMHGARVLRGGSCQAGGQSPFFTLVLLALGLVVRRRVRGRAP